MQGCRSAAGIRTIDELGKNKARLILLNKADLAEEKWNDAWAEYFKKKGYSVVKVNSKRGGGSSRFRRDSGSL